MKDFHAEESVIFGDVVLSENRVMVGSPGAGGWPTVRKFNKATGYCCSLDLFWDSNAFNFFSLSCSLHRLEGEAYNKATGDAMCTELGPGKPFLHDWIRSHVSGGTKDEL